MRYEKILPRYSNHIAAWRFPARSSVQNGKVMNWYSSPCTQWRSATLTATSTSKKRNWKLNHRYKSHLWLFFLTASYQQFSEQSKGILSFAVARSSQVHLRSPVHSSFTVETQFMLWNIPLCVLVQMSTPTGRQKNRSYWQRQLGQYITSSSGWYQISPYTRQSF